MALLNSDTKRLKQGDAAPTFSLLNVDGKTVSLTDFQGNPILVIFMCNHCPYVKPKLAEISALQKIQSGAVKVICISSNDVDYVPEDSFDEMKKVAKQFGIHCYLFDETQEAARSFGATCTPDPFLFDKNHKLVFHGRINDAMNPGELPKRHVMREMIEMMISGKQIKEWFLPSMGCSIKWKN